MQVERLLAEAIAREEHALLACVPERERELAAQVLHHVLVPVLIGAQQHLGVGVALEAIAALVEIGAQLAEVVDLAVERERDARGLVAHRLARAVRVDDGEAPVAEHHAMAAAGDAIAHHALAVGPAVRDRVEHRGHRRVLRRVARRRYPACDAAHGTNLL